MKNSKEVKYINYNLKTLHNFLFWHEEQ
jgi:hypothetical protein